MTAVEHLAAEGVAEVARVTIVPSTVSAVLFLLLSLCVPTRAKRLMVVLSAAACVVALAAYAVYLPSSA